VILIIGIWIVQSTGSNKKGSLAPFLVASLYSSFKEVRIEEKKGKSIKKRREHNRVLQSSKFKRSVYREEVI
jgi:hypothetical protein